MLEAALLPREFVTSFFYFLPRKNVHFENKTKSEKAHKYGTFYIAM
jgi:hypothetical protein